MQKSLIAIVFRSLTAGMMVLGIAQAQQTPAASTNQTTAPSASSAQAKAPAAKKAPSTTAKGATGLTLKTKKEKTSYALGMSIGTGLRKQGVAPAVDPAIVSRGLRDAIAGSKTLLTEDEMKTVLQQLRTDLQAAQEAKAHEAGGPARKAGEEFLAANKAKEGVKVLPDGLQYKVLTEGTGPKPTASDTVTVNYRGTLINGKEFDSSYKRGQPIAFPVGQVIKGWTEALQLMPVGSKWQLFIPPDLAYGDRGAGSDIGPGETLIFEVELIAIGDQTQKK